MLPANEPERARPRARARPRLLLAEDSPVNQQVVVAMLRRLGYRTDVVANGAEVLEALSRRSYGAVLMDCQMPEMDGYEAAREIRNREGNERHTPIIAMTAGAMEGDREKCLAAGMDDHVAKPVAVDALGAALERWTEDENARAAAPTKGSKSPPDAIDPARLAELRGLQHSAAPDILAELVPPFLDAAAVHLATLRAALGAEDADALTRAAHALKGSSANLGASQLAALGAELERLGQAGELALAAETLARLETELDRVQAAFRAEVEKGAPD